MTSSTPSSHRHRAAVFAAVYAEWTKVRTVRGTTWLPLAAVALFVALSAAVSGVTEPGTTVCDGGCDPVRTSLIGVYSGQIAVVVLAVLVMTAEYDTGLIAVTLTAVPRRSTVLAAKAVVLVAVVLPTALVSVAGALILFRDSGSAAGPALRAGAGTVLYLVLVALLGLGVATALRHTAPALTVLLARIVPDERWHARIERYAPMTAGLDGSLRGSMVLAGYALLALTLGAMRLLWRDA